MTRCLSHAFDNFRSAANNNVLTILNLEF